MKNSQSDPTSALEGATAHAPTIYAESVHSGGISIITNARSIASLDLQPAEYHGIEFAEYAATEGVTHVLWFCRISVLRANQGNGDGTALMSRIVEICDHRNWWIVNEPNPYDPRDRAKLLKFYFKYGFKTSQYLTEGVLLRKSHAAPGPIDL